MRNPSAAFATGLIDAPLKGLAPRRFFYVKAQDRATGVITGYGFWTGSEDLTFTVMDGITGALVSRIYYGFGTELVIPVIPRVNNLTIQTVSVKLPQNNPIVQEMTRTKKVRFSKMDIHEGQISVTTRLSVGNPEIAFLGECNRDPVETPAANGQGSVTIECVSDAIRGLTIPNPAKRSYQHQYDYSNDLFGKYGNSFENVTIPWGE